MQYILLGIILVSILGLVGSNPISNSNFNEHIREFSLKEDDINSTKIKTLLRDETGRSHNFSPVQNLVRFKDASLTPDSDAAGSSHSRGFSHNHQGFRSRDYEEVPYYGYEQEYHLPVHDHSFHHEHAPHHLDHHKHYNHALAAKAILWPIAGIALLGAAAALVANPVLLQLGVATGKRRRRDTDEVTGFDIDLPWSDIDRPNEVKSKCNCGDTFTQIKKKNNTNLMPFRRKHSTYKLDNYIQIPIETIDT